ncbi:kinesin-like protein KIF21A isoform X2 [Drosophila guanche]|uniref:Blast:Kinesin-like protein KIF21A n=1 Tax=Drosophila guanche TaxID=7266 RepID=A0A3B0JGZ2_DROGU|nr:kinesin-like protein KIF21A isoform X2 [Drosophila guanche]SPP81664.1 blast:Kinesin-like protein KIF21A [Drosophila guanche]
MISEEDPIKKDSSVRVAVRIRPQNSRELMDMCRICTSVTIGEPQILLGSDKAFTFDFVYDCSSKQDQIYDETVRALVESTLQGYNATVLAYGQTGSGKTYTMGTGFERESDDVKLGIVPRAIQHIFAGIEDFATTASEMSPANGNPQFSLAVQYIELYNEDIFDLLDPFNKNTSFKIHEAANGQIEITGASIKPISHPQDALKFLQQGALARTTASTKMNDQSSRSHALFTIFVRRQRLLTPTNDALDNDLETLTSKFHFVDLAGSERLKRTLATGERAREGISINCGLLSLGNCISALGDKSKRALHVPYRDSKLTRLLQDSLGGNSRTLMIACVSPSDRDFMETLNTLKYANRARNIRNKVQINKDQSSRTISQLRRDVSALQLELLEYKQGKIVVDCEGNATRSDTFNENILLLSENKRLKQRLNSMQETINTLTDRNAHLKLEKDLNKWSYDPNLDLDKNNVVEYYIKEIEKLKAKLIESKEMQNQLKIYIGKWQPPLKNVYNDQGNIINLAKKGLERDKELLMSRSLPGIQNQNDRLEESDTSSSDSEEEGAVADLNDINSDIEIKSKLIEQLELSQERMELMRRHYEEKLTVLNCKILNTQKERDEFLTNMVSSTSVSSQSKDSLKKMKTDYERKITNMQSELKRLQHAQTEHIRQHRELKSQGARINTLRIELEQLKFTKVKLMKSISEQSSRHKEEDSKKSKTISKLQDDQRRQKNALLSLKEKINAKDQMLKRKTEEVIALRKSQRGRLSQRGAFNLVSKVGKSTRSTHQQWEKLYGFILHASRTRQLITQLEKELQRLILEREDLCRELKIMQNDQNVDKTSEDFNEQDSLKTNIRYLQETIEHVQQAIMEFEDSKDTSQSGIYKIQNFLDNIRTVEEAKYILQKLSDSAIILTCNLAIAETHLQETESLLQEAQQENSIQHQILQHFLSQNSNMHISDVFVSLNLKSNINTLSHSSQKSLISSGTYDVPKEDIFGDSKHKDTTEISNRTPSPSGIDTLPDISSKIRRRTAQKQDLLFGDNTIPLKTDRMSRSYTQNDVICDNPLMRVSSTPGSL